MSKYQRLSVYEKEQISKMLAADCTFTHIAVALGRSISTIGREVLQNHADGEYLAIEATKRPQNSRHIHMYY
jgi:IS30 family transposase